MPPPDLIDRTANHVREVLSGDGIGHDWWQVYRVWKMARRIGRAEQADLVVVELAALLHDMAICSGSSRNGRGLDVERVPRG